MQMILQGDYTKRALIKALGECEVCGSIFRDRIAANSPCVRSCDFCNSYGTITFYAEGSENYKSLQGFLSPTK